MQGEGAAQSIVNGIHAMEQLHPDILIVGRGGGSIEDLWAFNEEIVARAIFDCPIPVISAVGHETDTTIADYEMCIRDRLGFLPEAQNDMIFSIICEELGLFGAVCVILLFLLMLWRFMVIANNAPDLYGALLVVGIMAHISIQVILNIAVVTNSIPNTGITLPFISYGGTSVLFLLSEMGLALSVSRGIRLRCV